MNPRRPPFAASRGRSEHSESGDRPTFAAICEKRASERCQPRKDRGDSTDRERPGGHRWSFDKRLDQGTHPGHLPPARRNPAAPERCANEGRLREGGLRGPDRHALGRPRCLQGWGALDVEIKTGATVRSCLREALGQLLEYALWPGATKPARLVVVGTPPLEGDAIPYIEKLNKAFPVSVAYRQVSLD